MDKVQDHLVNLSNSLDEKRKITCANAVDQLIKHQSVKKVAQYVGVIGYVLKQYRAMANCLRRKRAENSSKPYQEVVMSCLRDYQDAQDYNNTSWTEKYAQVVKQAPEAFDRAHLEFAEQLLTKNDIQSHIDRIAQTTTLLAENEESDNLLSEVLEAVEELHLAMREEDPSRPFEKAAAVQVGPLWFQRLHEPASGYSRGQNAWWLPTKPTEETTKFQTIFDTFEQELLRLEGSLYSVKAELSRGTPKGNAGAPELNKVMALLNNLNPSDWRETYSVVDTIRSQALSLHRQFSGNPAVRFLFEIAMNLHRYRSTVYASFVRLSQYVEYLRQVRGVMTSNQYGQNSQKEWDLLYSGLKAWESNPFNESAMHDVRVLLEMLSSRVEGRPFTYPEFKMPQYQPQADQPEQPAAQPPATPASKGPQQPAQSVQTTQPSVAPTKQPPKKSPPKPPATKTPQQIIRDFVRQFKKEYANLSLTALPGKVQEFVQESRSLIQTRPMPDAEREEILQGLQAKLTELTTPQKTEKRLPGSVQKRTAPRLNRTALAVSKAISARMPELRQGWATFSGSGNLDLTDRLSAVNGGEKKGTTPSETTKEFRRAKADLSELRELDEESLELLREYIEDHKPLIELPKFPEVARILVDENEGTRK